MPSSRRRPLSTYRRAVDDGRRRPSSTRRSARPGRYTKSIGDRASRTIRSARAPGRQRADVVAPQRGGAAGGRRQDRLVGRHPELAHGEGDAERHRRRVAGTRVAVGGERHRDAGVDHPPGVGVRLAGGEVGGREERRHRRAAGQRVDVAGRRGRCSGRRTRSRARHRGAHRRRGRAGWRAGAARGRRARPASSTARHCSGVNAPRLAERVDPAGVRGAAVEHLAADEVDVVVGPPGVLVGNDVGTEERGLRGQLGGHPRARRSSSSVARP